MKTAIIWILILLAILLLFGCGNIERGNRSTACMQVYADGWGTFYGDSVQITDCGCILYQGKDSLVFSHYPVIISKRKLIE